MKFNIWHFYTNLSTVHCWLGLNKNCRPLTQKPNYIYVIWVWMVFISKAVCSVRYQLRPRKNLTI